MLRNKRTIMNDNADIFNNDENDNDENDNDENENDNDEMTSEEIERIFSKAYNLNQMCMHIYYAGEYIFQYTYKGIKIFINVSGIYLVWIFLHYIAAQLYIKLCVPNTIVGFLMSPFMTATPHCQGLRWVVYNAANIINNMWIILGAWICSTFLIINRDNTPAPVGMSS